MLCALTWPDLSRAGYSPDEEFTIFAVRGIAAHGLPLLPSNLLYDRGLAYSYMSWTAGALAGGESLAAYRAVSVLGALAGALLLAREIARMRGRWAGLLGLALVIGSIPFWVSASTARFYGPLLFFYVAALLSLSRSTEARWHLGTFASVVLARWCHELAFTLALVPAVCFLVAPRGERRPWFVRGLIVGAALVCAQLVLIWVNRLAPTSGDTMVQRFFLWQALNLFEPPAFGFGIPMTLAAGVILVRPDLARRTAEVALVVTGMLVAFTAASLLAGGMPLAQAASRIGFLLLEYPLDLFAYLLGRTPLLLATAIGAFAARAAGWGGAWSARERAAHALWIGWVLWFGVIESGVTARYLLLPVTFMLAAIALDLAAVLQSARSPRAWPRVAAVGLALGLVVESWYGLPLPGSAFSFPRTRLAEARPTINAASLAADIRERDVVACTDELACLLLAGRIDAWLVLDDFFRERFIVMRDRRPQGVYTGAEAADEIVPLLQRAERQDGRLLVVDVLKDVPGFGSNARLVERALAREGLDWRLVTGAPHVRVMEIGSKEMFAQRVMMSGDWSANPSR